MIIKPGSKNVMFFSSEGRKFALQLSYFHAVEGFIEPLMNLPKAIYEESDGTIVGLFGDVDERRYPSLTSFAQENGLWISGSEFVSE